MTKYSLIAFFLLLLSSPSRSQDITGSWNGVLDVMGNKLRIVFNVTQTDTGYVSTMDSPNQGARGIPVTRTTYKKPDIRFELPALGITYEGKLQDDTMFVGDFKQSGFTFKLLLTRSAPVVEALSRPQEPKPPYPYYTEDVKFENVDDGVILAGTLTLLEKEGKFPAVILISGSGAQNRNEELMGHKPFLVLADYLTRQGIAVLRYDDRGAGESTGDRTNATSEDYARDVVAAIRYLKTRKEINKKDIGLIGHSEGGLIAPLVASKNKDVSFIVLLAAPGVQGYKLLLKQQEAIGKASGLSDEELKNSSEINRELFEMVLNSKDDNALKEELTKYLQKIYNELPESEKPKGIDAETWANRTAAQVSSPWMVYFLRYDPAPVLQKVKCPVLALNGNKDLQVDAKMNLEGIRVALEKGGNKNVTVKEFPGLNHLFQECKTGLPTEYYSIEQTFYPEVLNVIARWINNVVK